MIWLLRLHPASPAWDIPLEYRYCSMPPPEDLRIVGCMRASERKGRKRVRQFRRATQVVRVGSLGGPAALGMREDSLHTPLRALSAHELGSKPRGPLGLSAIQLTTLTTPRAASGAPPALPPAGATRGNSAPAAASNRYRYTASARRRRSPWLSLRAQQALIVEARRVGDLFERLDHFDQDPLEPAAAGTADRPVRGLAARAAGARHRPA